MEIVIKIPEEIMEYIKNNGILSVIYVDEVVNAITSGAPLPKGHGRLIDADALEKKMCDREEELGDAQALWESSEVSVALDNFAPTIIEADKE